ncbi:MAG: hypothetical protein ABIR50_11295 [Ginsengibacter sp.]
MKPNKQSLPELNDIKKISQKQIEEFRENGHTIFPGLLSSEEVAAYHSVISNAALKYNIEKRKMEDRDTYAHRFYHSQRGGK